MTQIEELLLEVQDVLGDSTGIGKVVGRDKGDFQLCASDRGPNTADERDGRQHTPMRMRPFPPENR